MRRLGKFLSAALLGGALLSAAGCSTGWPGPGATWSFSRAPGCREPTRPEADEVSWGAQDWNRLTDGEGPVGPTEVPDGGDVSVCLRDLSGEGEGNYLGLTSEGGRLVEIDDQATYAAKGTTSIEEVAAHEFGHVLCGHAHAPQGPNVMAPEAQRVEPSRVAPPFSDGDLEFLATECGLAPIGE
jgi:hypothetical protein